MKLLLDTNVLALLVVGRTDPRWIQRHKRLTAWAPPDYYKLEGLLDRASGLVTVPHIAAETSNILAFGSPHLMKRAFYQVLRQYLERAHEIAIPSLTAASTETFLRLGLTDSAVEKVATDKSDLEVVTADGLLWAALRGAGIRCTNFALVAEPD